ncbi:MAG: LuxR C-terminal-related transcriptional regulator [Actinomycetota bacterium]
MAQRFDDAVELAPAEPLAVASKLHPPRRRRGHVARTDLLEHIAEYQPDLLLVTAAAGYGKSTLLADLAANDGRPSAWLTIDRAHNEASVLLGDVAYVLSQLEPIDPQVRADLATQRASIASASTHRFAHMLGSRRTPFLLILDDVHELTSLEALDALTVIVDELPAGSLVALGSRSLPSLPLARWRTRHTVVEIGQRDLALGATIVTAMYAALAVDISPDEAAVLTERTEGWPLALYLAALARRSNRGDRARLDVAGDTRVMVEYFSEVVLSGVEADVADLLLRVAPLEQFSGPLCDHLLDRRGSASVLEDLHRRNLLVIALDERRQWYRLHHLLSEYLTAELERREPGEAAATLRAASAWHEDRGEAELAVACAARSGDVDRTAHLVVRYFPLYVNLGRQATLERWLGWFSHADLLARPLLLTAGAHASHVAGDGVAALTLLEQAMVAIGAERPITATGSDPAVALAVARASIGWLTADDVASEAAYARARLRPGAFWHPFSCTLEATSHALRGNSDRAVELLREAITGGDGRPLIRSLSLAILALVHIDLGAWDAAAECSDESARVLDDRWTLPAACPATAVRALVLAHQGRLDEAADLHQVARLHISGFAPVSPWFNLVCRLALARASALAGRTVEATTLLDEAEVFLAAMPDARAAARQMADIRRSVASGGHAASFGPSSLTTAELRVLQYLPTHLSVGEIAERLYLSRNTVKTHTVAIYRKLGTTSRSGAVDIARTAGLID